MPGYKKHLYGGLFSYFFLLIFIKFIFKKFLFLDYLIFLFFSLLGSVFLDIDIRSKIQKLSLKACLVFIFYGIIFNKINLILICSWISLFIIFLKHKVITHNIKFVFFLPTLVSLNLCLFYKFSTNMIFFSSLFFIFGAISHLFLDYFFPLKKRKIFKKNKFFSK